MGTEDQGFRATFEHPTSGEYTMLLKGHDLVQASQACRQESIEHGAAFVRLETWVRSNSLNRKVSRLWCSPEGDRWE